MSSELKANVSQIWQLRMLPSWNHHQVTIGVVHAHKCTTYNHPITGKTTKIRGAISCSTKNVIYLLKCQCGLAYVGKTQRALKTRIAEHRSNFRTQDQRSPVALHFKEANHSLRYISIEHVKYPRRGGDLNNLLLLKESFYIFFPSDSQSSRSKPGVWYQTFCLNIFFFSRLKIILYIIYKKS